VIFPRGISVSAAKANSVLNLDVSVTFVDTLLGDLLDLEQCFGDRHLPALSIKVECGK
jgi:hypothetical protein